MKAKRSSPTPPTFKPCPTCGHTFKAYASDIKRGGGKYCSISCRPFSGAGNPKWRGGRVVDPDGRVLIYAPNHPRPNYCGTHVYEYRLVAEQMLGRFLVNNEIVHHIDGDPTNNAPENLRVMTQSEHIREHGLTTRNKAVAL